MGQWIKIVIYRIALLILQMQNAYANIDEAVYGIRIMPRLAGIDIITVSFTKLSSYFYT